MNGTRITNGLNPVKFQKLYPLHPLPRTWYIIKSHPITKESCYFLSFLPETFLEKVKKDPNFGFPMCFFSWIPKKLLDSYEKQADKLLPDHFTEWKPFLEYFHKDFMPKCLSSRKSCEEWSVRAKSLIPYTWMNLQDERIFVNTTPYPEDIFGAVKLDSQCDFLPSSYHDLFTYRLITLNGRFKLPKSVQEFLENDLCE